MANNAQTQVLFLEQTVESLYFLPSDLSRILNNIKALDERCFEISDALHERTAQLLSMPPAFQVAPGPEYYDLMQKVAADQRMLTQFSEEKVKMAQQAYDLLEMHALELERTMENFETDMRVGADAELNAALDGLTDVFTPQGVAGLDGRGRTPRLEDWNVSGAPDAYNSIPLPIPPLPTPAPLPPAMLPAFAAAGPITGPKRGSSAIQRSASQKKLKEETVTPPPGFTGPIAPPPPTSSGSNSQLPPTLPTTLPTALPNPLAAMVAPMPPPNAAELAGLPAGLPTDDLMLNGAAPPLPGATGGGELPVMGFLTPPPPGLQAQAQQPQVPGCFLHASDIGPGLKGRHAELYWPDDASWYLIEIQDVDPETNKARIMYLSGEVEEELSLEDIVKDKHMTLMPLSMYQVLPPQV